MIDFLMIGGRERFHIYTFINSLLYQLLHFNFKNNLVYKFIVLIFEYQLSRNMVVSRTECMHIMRHRPVYLYVSW